MFTSASEFRPGDRVQFQHNNPNVPDTSNGRIGTVVEAPHDFFGYIAVRFDGDAPDDLGAALPDELTRIEETP
jgi:hypothetical protein